MCLIAFAWQPEARMAFVLVGNRDEYFARQTVPADWWPAHPQVLAGRDLAGGGTWCGVTRTGRLAALTNYRAPHEFRADAPSRGALVAAFLEGLMAPAVYAQELLADKGRYNGFNLLTAAGLGGPGAELWIDSNRMPEAPRALAPGIYGVSNAALDTPWPKVTRAKGGLARALAEEADWDGLRDALLDLLADAAQAPAAELPATGVAPEMERALSAAFIRLPGYGTRATTVIAIERDGSCHFVERSFAADGGQSDRSFDYSIAA